MNVDEWDEFVASSEQGTPFQTSWWLEAVAPSRWQINEVRDENGRISAAWPTIVRKHRSGLVHTGAPLTPVLGPLLTAPRGKRHYSRVISQLEQLVERLGSYAHLEARMHHSIDYWTPLHWHGFTQTTHYTWRIEDCSDADAIKDGFRDSVRRQLRKAEREELIVEECSIEEFIPLQQKTFGRQGLDGATPPSDLLRRIDRAAGEKKQRKILVARDSSGRAHAAHWYVFDEKSVWYLMGGSDPALRSSGAATLLMWHGMMLAAEDGRAFDFEGSMLKHVERFVRAFGGKPVPYSHVWSTPARSFRFERDFKRTINSLRRP